MNSSLKPIRVAIPFGVVALVLGGCAVEPPGDPSLVALQRSQVPAYAPQPVYVGPAPRYVGAPMIIYPPYPYY
jgi:hypothetical protein